MVGWRGLVEDEEVGAVVYAAFMGVEVQRFCSIAVTGVAGLECAGDGEADCRGVRSCEPVPLGFLTRWDCRRECGLELGFGFSVMADMCAVVYGRSGLPVHSELKLCKEPSEDGSWGGG